MHIVLAYDSGTSESKVIYKVEGKQPKLMFVSPDYVELPNGFVKSLEEEESLLHIDPLQNAWFNLSKKGDCILVGKAAASRGFRPELEKPKYLSLTYKIIGTLCAIAARERRQSETLTADVIALLPIGEFEDASVVKQELYRLLDGRRKIYFQGSPVQIKLGVFHALPEGGGIILALPEYQQEQTAILMLGYRNASVLAFDKGSFNKGRSASKNLGFYQLADRIVAKHSYLNREDILDAIDVQSGADTADVQKCQPVIWPQRLVRASDSDSSLREEKRLARTIELATLEYIKLLESWLLQVLSPVERWQFICVVGGTAQLFKPQIEEFLAQHNQRADWCPQIAGETLRQFKLNSLKYGDRLAAIRAADVWSAFKSFLESVEPEEQEQEEEPVRVVMAADS